MARSPLLKALSAAMALVLVLGLMPLPAFAEGSTSELTAGESSLTAQSGTITGTWGTCPWEITSGGTLIVHPGTGGKSYSSNKQSYWYSYSTTISSVVFKEENGEKVIAPSNCSYLLAGFNNHLRSVDFSGLDTSNVTNMNGLFYYDNYLSNIIAPDFDTSKVTSMAEMFQYCGGQGCKFAESFDVSSVMIMNSMFDSAHVSKLDLSSWNTASVTDMGEMFAGCDTLSELNVSGWKTGQVTNMYRMFYKCKTLKALDTTDWDVSNVKTTQEMFALCSELNSLDVSKWNVSSATSMHSMFQFASKLESLDVSKWKPSSCAWFSCMFLGCTNLKPLDVSGWDVSNGVHYESMFGSCKLQTKLDVSKWNMKKAQYTNSMFSSCTALTDIDMSGCGVQDIREASGMFSRCESLKTANLAGWGAQKLTTVNSMFLDCASLQEANLASWDATILNDMYSMFSGCSSLTDVDMTNWTTWSVQMMNAVFSNCSSLKKLDLSSWNTASVRSMSYLFSGCTSLEELKLGKYFKFVSYGGTASAMLRDAPTDGDYTGKWICRETGRAFTAEELMSSYNGRFSAGTYVWETKGGWTRVAGGNRYATMLGIVGEGFSYSDWAVVATGDNYPDALAASALAGVKGCPVVLTAKDKLTAQAKSALTSLGVKNVYIMGGTGAVSANVEKAITELKGMESVTRIAGKTRTATAAEAMKIVKQSSDSKTVIVATGYNYADSLSIGPWSYATGSPIALTRADGTLDAATVEAIKECGYESFIILGGPKAVAPTVETQLKNAGLSPLGNAGRISGSTRYDTSKAIADFSLANGLTMARPAVATGENYPDALAGAAMQGRTGSIMVLVKNVKSPSLATLSSNKAALEHGFVLGGTNAVPDTLMRHIEVITG